MMSKPKEDIMNTNVKLLMMMLLVGFSLSCASTSDLQKNEAADAITKKQSTQAKSEVEEKEYFFQDERHSSLEW